MLLLSIALTRGYRRVSLAICAISGKSRAAFGRVSLFFKVGFFESGLVISTFWVFWVGSEEFGLGFSPWVENLPVYGEG